MENIINNINKTIIIKYGKECNEYVNEYNNKINDNDNDNDNKTVDTYNCNLCNYLTNNKYHFNQHCQSNLNHIYKEEINKTCVLCNKQYNTSKTYKNHKYNVHNRKKNNKINNKNNL